MKTHIRVLLVVIFSIFLSYTNAQLLKKHTGTKNTKEKPHKKPITHYGVASYYAKKFNGRKTTNGETYQHEKYTAACNILPLNTWIKVTNLKNNKSVIVKINDRMNRKNKRLVDLSQSAAKKLGYFSSGLTRVKVEVLKGYSPDNIPSISL
ncbi:MAG: septal ring lytic transglycosylase RlpA family protein [Bacteroidota bacterium]|nr:septal ring lytic transglycosylase RlpA family protein [Bacteroidota bacterium]